MRLTISNSVGALLVLNLVASFLWIFGVESIRLLLLSGSGFCLLLLFYFRRSSVEIDILKFLVILLIVRGMLNFSMEDYIATLAIDLSALGIITSFSVFHKISYKYFVTVMTVGIIGILIFYLFTLQYVDFSLVLDSDLERRDMFTSIKQSDSEDQGSGYVVYHTQQLIMNYLVIFLLLLPIFIRSFNRLQITIILLATAAAFISYSAFYQKRQSLVEFALIIILTIIFHKKAFSHILPNNLLIYLLLIGTGIYFLISSDLLVNVFDRFQQVSDLEDFDRLEEAVQVLGNFDVLDLILGKGLGYKAVNTPGGSILHIGYANIFMKGGLLFLGYYLFQSFKNFIYCLRRSGESPLFLTGCSITVFSMVSLTYSPGYHWFLISLVMGLSMFSRYFFEILHQSQYYNDNFDPVSSGT